MYGLTEDVIMEFLPPRVKGGMNYDYGHERIGVDSRTTHILEDPTAVHALFDFLPRLKEFVQK
jgi:hypothetical protein